MSYDACEIATVYNTTEPIARVSHPCCECTAPILPGEKHVKVFMVCGGDIETHRQHTLCAEACEAVRDEGLADPCLAWGYFKEWWIEDGKRGGKTDAFAKKIRAIYARILRRERARPSSAPGGQ